MSTRKMILFFVLPSAIVALLVGAAAGYYAGNSQPSVVASDPLPTTTTRFVTDGTKLMAITPLSPEGKAIVNNRAVEQGALDVVVEDDGCTVHVIWPWGMPRAQTDRIRLAAGGALYERWDRDVPLCPLPAAQEAA
jgi:hypothetical protein